MAGVNAKLDRLFEGVVAKTDIIIRAHDELGIPLEDLLCAAVRKAASLKVIEAGQQELALGDAPARRRPEGRRA